MRSLPVTWIGRKEAKKAGALSLKQPGATAHPNTPTTPGNQNTHHRRLVASCPPETIFTQGSTRSSTKLERALVIVVLLVGAQALFFLFRDLPYSGQIEQGIWALAYLLIGLLAAHSIGMRMLVTPYLWYSGLYIVLVCALASVLWSINPAVTMRGSISLVGTTVIGVYAGLHLSREEIVRVLSTWLAILLVLSVVMVALNPDLSTLDRVGTFRADAWKGAALTKNRLAAFAAVGVLLFLTRVLAKDIGILQGLFLLVLSLTSVAMAKSVTAVAMLASSILFLVVTRFARVYRPASIIAVTLIVFASIAMAVILMQDSLLDLVGREETFTGRTMIWRTAFALIADRPMTGWGFEAIWGYGLETKLPQYRATIWAAHAHNSTLQIATDLGVLAAIIAVIYVLFTFFQGLRVSRPDASTFELFAPVVIFMLIISSLSESHFFAAQNSLWIIFVAVSTSLMRHRGREYRISPNRAEHASLVKLNDKNA